MPGPISPIMRSAHGALVVCRGGASHIRAPPLIWAGFTPQCGGNRASLWMTQGLPQGQPATENGGRKIRRKKFKKVRNRCWRLEGGPTIYAPRTRAVRRWRRRSLLLNLPSGEIQESRVSDTRTGPKPKSDAGRDIAW